MQIYQVDAFAAGLFQGNPAAVIPLTEWLPDDVMQAVAMENNLSETAFFIPVGKGLGLDLGEKGLGLGGKELGPGNRGLDAAGKGLGPRGKELGLGGKGLGPGNRGLDAAGKGLGPRGKELDLGGKGSDPGNRGLDAADKGLGPGGKEVDLAGKGSDAAREGYAIRWFTPSLEVDLCGHATLASGHVLFEHLGHPGDAILFHTRKAGDLQVLRGDAPGRYTLNFPDILPEPVDAGAMRILFEGLGLPEGEVLKGPYDHMIVLDSQAEVEGLRPDFRKLASAPGRGIIVTAPGGEPGIDFVSRGFFPQSGIDEDPVTGSAHSMLVPYWASRLGKQRLSAVQLSARRGYLDCLLDRGRVYMTGNAVTFLKGEIYL